MAPGTAMREAVTTSQTVGHRDSRGGTALR